MKAKEITDEQLLDYLDGNMKQPERELLTQIIEKHPEVKARLQDLEHVDSMLSEMAVKKTSAHFVSSVMEDLKNKPYSIKKGGFLIVLVAFFTVLLGAYYTVGDMIDLSIIKQDDYFSQLRQYIPNTINLKTINTVLLGALSLFSLLIFDKTVLKPFFQKRKYHY